MSKEGESSEEPAKKPAKKKRPELRASALLIGLPLVFFFFLPWDIRDPYTLPPMIAAPLIVMGIAGVVAVVLAFASEPVRLRGLPIVGGLLAALGVWLFETVVASGALHGGMDHLPRLTVYGWFFLPIAAMGAEMAMHRHPRSRRLAVVALVAWLGVVAVSFLPLYGALDWRSSPVGQLMRALEDHPFRLPLDYALPLAGSLLGLLGALQCLRRVGSDRERAAERRFRTSVLAWLLVPVPTLALTSLMILNAALGQAGWVTKHFHVGFAIFATTLGGALAVRALLGTDWARTRSPKRALAVLSLAVAVIVGRTLYVAFVPRTGDGDDEVIALANEIGDALTAGLRGEPVERRFLGNYSSVDLRGAAGAIELPPDARLTHVGLRVYSDGHYGYALVDEAGDLGWVALDDERITPEHEPDDVPDWLESGPTEPTIWDRVPERFGTPGCLPSPSDIPTVLADHLQYARPACNQLQLRELRGPRYVTGTVGGYIAVYSGGEETIAVGGELTTRASGAWVGMPRPIADYPPPNALHKWVEDID